MPIIAHPVPVKDLKPQDVAHILDKAAQVIEENGLHDGSYWPDQLDPWSDELPCCTAGAIGVATGYRFAGDVDRCIVGTAWLDDSHRLVEEAVHPALQAVMDHLGITQVEDLFKWSDDRRADQVVPVLREVAAKLRTAVA